MSVYHFSKSRYCNCIQCPKIEAGVLTGKYLQQVEAEIKNLPAQIDKKNIKGFLDTLSYPL